jgi:hypothetical protein
VRCLFFGAAKESIELRGQGEQRAEGQFATGGKGSETEVHKATRFVIDGFDSSYC